MAFYHRGMTIEFNAYTKRLRIDGQEVSLPSGSPEWDAGGESSLVNILRAQQLAETFIDFEKRDSIRNEHTAILSQGCSRWNEWRREFSEIRPFLYDSVLDDANLDDFNLANANMIGAKLRRAKLRAANLHEANLGGADLSDAHLECANLCRTDLYKTKLIGAFLNSANLQGTQLAQTDFSGATLDHCTVYGLSAWDLTTDKDTKQKELVVLVQGIPAVTVDSLELSQFIYLLLNNQRIQKVIDTLTNKVVLLLGRFTPSRKKVLDTLREELRHHDYVPVLFDFDIPSGRDISETVGLLARMSRFVIADLTEPSSIPKELESFVPNIAVPIQPLLESTQAEYSMFKDYWKYDWVLPVYRYESCESLVAGLTDWVLAPAENKIVSLNARRPAYRGDS
ncbi:MAG: pentapeptide repeat-containing protein [Methylococcaceae bacterium]